MGLFIFGVIVGLIGLGLLIVRELSDGNRRLRLWPWGLAVMVIALVMVTGSTLRTVPARSVGIEVTFGKVTGALDPGLHSIAPWTGVKKFPATVQTTRFFNDGNGKGEESPCITVRLANQTTACVHMTVQWSIDTSDKPSVEALYARWRGFDHIEPNLIIPQTRHAVLAPFETYDPLKVLATNGQLVVPTGAMEKATHDQLVAAVGKGIVISQVTINLIAYDQTTQEKLNSFSQSIADTRIAEQRQQTAEAQRKANDALAASSASKDPAVLTQNCLDVTERMTKEGKTLPAAWTCLGSAAQTVVPVR